MSALLTFAGFLPPFLLIPAYAVADRAWGDDTSFAGEKAVIVVALGIAGFLAAGPTGALFALAWLIYRCLPFPKGSQNPRTPSETLRATLRHAPAIVLAVLIAYWRDLDQAQTGLAFGFYVIAAVSLAFAYGHRTNAVESDIAAGEITAAQGLARLKKFYPLVEVLRGLAFGIATAVSLSV